MNEQEKNLVAQIKGHPDLEFCDDCGKDFAITEPDAEWKKSFYLGNYIIYNGQFICRRCRDGIRTIKDWFNMAPKL